MTLSSIASDLFLKGLLNCQGRESLQSLWLLEGFKIPERKPFRHEIGDAVRLERRFSALVVADADGFVDA